MILLWRKYSICSQIVPTHPEFISIQLNGINFLALCKVLIISLVWFKLHRFAIQTDCFRFSYFKCGYGVQKSESFITTRLAVDCYDDTHYTSGTYDKVRERRLKAKELYKALQGFTCTEDCTPLVRTKSRDYTLPGNIKVYETVYAFTLHDESAMQEGAARFIRP